MDRRAGWAAVRGVTLGQTLLSGLSMTERLSMHTGSMLSNQLSQHFISHRQPQTKHVY